MIKKSSTDIFIIIKEETSSEPIIPTPTEGFNLSNSEIADVNGDYHEVKIAGINPEDYTTIWEYSTAIYEYLVNHNELEDDDEIKGDISSLFYTNGKCYIHYGGLTTYILPKGGSSIHFYYKSMGGEIPISEMKNEATRRKTG